MTVMTVQKEIGDVNGDLLGPYSPTIFKNVLCLGFMHFTLHYLL